MGDRHNTPLSDQYNAEALVQAHGADLRYCLDWREWLYWTGHQWSHYGHGEAMRRAKRTIRGLSRLIDTLDDPAEIKAYLNHMKSSLSASRLEGMVRLAQSEDGIEIRSEALDTNPWLLNGPNLAKTKILAKYNTINQVDRLHGGRKPAHAVREWEERERFSVT